MSDHIDTIDINVLIAALMRRRQESVGAMIALLDLMVLMSGNTSAKSKYQLANLLRDKADLVERSN
jgi:hypothetical protein